ncbi:MAG: flagellar motor switch protein FliG [Thermodesulfobacteriota bacterium]
MVENKIRGLDKAAIFLANLGEEAATEVVKYLDPDEIQSIGRQMTSLRDVPISKFMEVAEEFEKEIQYEQGPDNINEYIKNVIFSALGPEKAEGILKRISRKPEEGGMETLKWMEPKVVADFIKNEHPQTIAVILSNLQPEQAAKVLLNMESRIRADVVMRVATMEAIAPGAIDELEDAINQNLSGTVGISTHSVGGVKAAAEILNQVDADSEGNILSSIETINATLATDIQEKMFVFSDIADIDDRGLQSIMKEVPTDMLILALKTAEDLLIDKFLDNMSARAREMFLEEMDSRGPARLSEVGKAQAEIVRITRQLEVEGEIRLGGGDADDLLV